VNDTDPPIGIIPVFPSILVELQIHSCETSLDDIVNPIYVDPDKRPINIFDGFGLPEAELSKNGTVNVTVNPRVLLYVSYD